MHVDNNYDSQLIMPLASVRNQNRVNDSWITLNVNDYSNIGAINLKYELKKRQNAINIAKSQDFKLN